MRTLTGEQTLVRIFFGESDKWHHQSLEAALLERLRREGFAGATVLGGVSGFSANSVIHTTRLLDLSSDLPVVVEIVDSESIFRGSFRSLTGCSTTLGDDGEGPRSAVRGSEQVADSLRVTAGQFESLPLFDNVRPGFPRRNNRWLGGRDRYISNRHPHDCRLKRTISARHMCCAEMGETGTTRRNPSEGVYGALMARIRREPLSTR